MDDRDWSDRVIRTARSVGGVLACENPWDALIRGGVEPWPPPELVQKVYASRQSRAYRDDALKVVTARHGFYSDLQSVHSEDAITWSLFGPLAYGPAVSRNAFVAELLEHALGTPRTPIASHIWLWRRLPHPDTLVSGGPEIDFGIQTSDVLVLGEAKWRSTVGAAQGIARNKDQIQLRVEFCEKYGPKLFPEIKQYVVMLVSQTEDGLSDSQQALATERVRLTSTSWDLLGSLESNPWQKEFAAHLEWRKLRSQAS